MHVPASSHRGLEFLSALAVVAFAAAGAAQCTPAWQPTEGVPGVLGAVFAAVPWDPDGPGPLAPRVVVGGDFLYAGTARVNRLAAYDPATGTWSAFANGLDGAVKAIVVLPNGDLVVGGSFGGAYGTISNGIVRWNGTSWSALGSGLSGWCNDLAVMPNGDVIATGTFATAGGVTVNGIARWNGASWSALGSGLGGTFPVGNGVAVRSNGDLVIVGDFTSAGGVAAEDVAYWDGAAWHAIPNQFFGAEVTAVAALPNGDVVTNPGPSLQRWDGTSWTFWPLGSMYPAVTSLQTMANGDLVVAGAFTSVGGVPAINLARWNGASWQAVADGNTPARLGAVAEVPGGDLYVGGGFDGAGSVAALSVARWQGGTWHPLGGGVSGAVIAMATDAAGNPLVLTQALSFSARLLRRNGSAWQVLGAPLQYYQRALAVHGNGDILVGGDAQYQGGWRPLRRWTGSSFVPLGTFAGGSGVPYVQCLWTMPDGSVMVGGDFDSVDGVAARNLVRWNGASWSAVGGSFPVGSAVHVLTGLANGDLVAAGRFSSVGGVPAANVARWNGVAWSSFGAGIPGYQPIGALAGMPNGDLVVGGSFTVSSGAPGDRLVRWNGSTWAPLGSGVDGYVGALAALPDGDVVVGGSFVMAGGVQVRGIARWNGTTFAAFGYGIGGDIGGLGNGSVWSLAFQRDGSLAVGGNFAEVDFAPRPLLAFLRSPCTAAASAVGSGCAGSGGPNVLAATTLPWTGSTFRASATGMPANAFALAVYGFAPASIPLAAILPQGLPGCTLLANPDLLAVHLPAGGAIATALALPDSVALAGQLLHHQVVPIELDLALNITALTSTNALSLTIGSF